MLQTHSTSPPAVMLQNGLVSGLSWLFGVGLGSGSCALGCYCSNCFVTQALQGTMVLPSWAFPGKQESQMLSEASEFALVSANGSSHCTWCSAFPKGKVCWLFSLGVDFLFCKPRAEEEAESCFPLMFSGCSLHWQAGLHSLGYGERELQVCPEPEAFTLAVSGLGEGMCISPWPGKTAPAACPSRLPPATSAKLLMRCFVSERGRGTAASSGDVPGRVSTQLSTFTQVVSGDTWCHTPSLHVRGARGRVMWLWDDIPLSTWLRMMPLCG